MSNPTILTGRSKKNKVYMNKQLYSTEPKITQPFTEYIVRLYFPLATTTPFEMSVSCACNSDYIKVIMDYDDEAGTYYDCFYRKENEIKQQIENITNKNIEQKYIDYVIPFAFYKTMRFIDIKWFIDLWKGLDVLYCNDDRKYNLAQTSQLCRAFYC